MKKEKGITLVALIVTIIVLLIISGVGITTGVNLNREANENRLLSELQMVQHAALERYTKVSLTGEAYPGTPYETIAEVRNAIPTILAEDSTIQLDGTLTNSNHSHYYLLAPSDLEKLGIQKATDSYIIHYERGEVMNQSIQKTSFGKVLYLRSKE